MSDLNPQARSEGAPAPREEPQAPESAPEAPSAPSPPSLEADASSGGNGASTRQHMKAVDGGLADGLASGLASGTAAEATGASGPEDDLYGFSEEELRSFLSNMILYRRFEEQAEQAYAIGKIGGFCHLHIGQEAVAEGTIKPLRADDYVITAYREHTQALAKGADAGAVMAELYGRAGGVSAGNGGSMHLFSAEHGFMGGHGIVGAQTALGAGLAFAAKYQGNGRVTLCFMGDAAVNQGALYESMNMAAIWDLPIIFVVENNDYGMGTKFDRVSETEIHERSRGMGIPSSQVNGQDVLVTYRHFEQLVAEVRAGGGPRFVDVLCYRFKGHSIADPSTGVYRTKEEVEGKMETADPIKVLADRMKAAGLITEDDVTAMDVEARKASEAAAEWADAQPLPDPAQLYENVYAEEDVHGRLYFDGRERPGSEG